MIKFAHNNFNAQKNDLYICSHKNSIIDFFDRDGQKSYISGVSDNQRKAEKPLQTLKQNAMISEEYISKEVVL